MRSQKSRSRGKNRNNNNRSMGNVVNRVFDSSGPEGKVRGTPQQIIEKYQALHRDAQLANDRVAAENFAQHAEHYARMLGEAQREQEARREAQEAQQRERDQQRDQQNRDHQQAQPQGDAGEAQNSEDRTQNAERSGEPKRSQRRNNAQNQDQPGGGSQPDVIDFGSSDAGDSGLVETVEAAPKPKRNRTRKPKTDPIAEATEASDSGAPEGEKPAAE